jgi:predicted nucleotidyltransferase
MLKEELINNIKNYLLSEDIKKAAIFGSFARNEETAKSDIDILIKGEKLSIFDILRIEDALQTISNRKIDIVEYDAIKPSLKQYIFQNTIQLI